MFWINLLEIKYHVSSPWFTVNKETVEYSIRQMNCFLVNQDELFAILELIGQSAQVVIVESFCEIVDLGQLIRNLAVDSDMF